jgi:hypothetical protein
MADPHRRFALLAGPYRPPRVRRGGKLFCEVHGTVTVGGYHDGPVPWPRDRKGGLPSLVLCGDLVAAVRAESAQAVARHFGVSRGVVRLRPTGSDVVTWSPRRRTFGVDAGSGGQGVGVWPAELLK